MNHGRRNALAAACIIALAAAASAQEGGIAPLPAMGDDSTLSRITPLDRGGDADMLSTKPVKHPEPAPVQAAPAIAAESASAPPPVGLTPLPWQPPAAVPAAKPATPTAKPNQYLPEKVPFGHTERPLAPEIPAGPHASVAVPVGTVDAVEVSEPAPASLPAPGADPVKEDASEPSELTSPLFEGAPDAGGPRKIVFRVLNKVTAQALMFKTKPNDTVTFGKLTINPLMCRNSSPNSQADSAGLLDIREQLPGKESMVKPLFRGWMYASSPSLTALEHPIYDVTMVDCEIAAAPPKEGAKATKKGEKAAAAKKK